MSDEPIWRRYLRFRGRDIDADVDEELRFHLEMHEQELRNAGRDAESARAEAEAAFGDVGDVRDWLRRHDRQRQRRRVRNDNIGHFLLELRYARRSVARNAAPSLTLVATLAIGIATATVMFSILDALLLRPLPFRDPDSLVDVMQVRPDGTRMPYFSFSDVQVWRDQPGVFADVLATSRTSLTYTGGAEPTTLVGLLAEHNFTRVLGVEPALGRSFSPADAEPGAPRVVLIDHDFWKGRFGGDPGVIGRGVELGGQPYEIIGVMPRDFRFPLYGTTDFWAPISRTGTAPSGEPVGIVDLVARLADENVDVSAERAAAAASALQADIPRDQGWNVTFTRIGDRRANGLGSSGKGKGEWLLIGSVITLLLASAANAAGLLLTRSWERTGELGLRLALGSSNTRLIAHVVLESLLIGVSATLFAGLISWLEFRLIQNIIPTDVTFYAPFKITLGSRAAVATFLLSVGLSLLISLPGALRATRLAQLSARGALTRYANLTPGSTRARSLLLYAQVSLSVVLLVGAVLLGSSYARLVDADPGQRIENVAALQLFFSPAKYPTDAHRADFVRRLEERLQGLPGVEKVVLAHPGMSDGIMFGSGLENGSGPVGGPVDIPYNEVSPDYFGAFEVAVVAGRSFTPEDAGTGNVVVNANLARTLAGGSEEAVGTRFRLGPEGGWQTIVGVVGEMRLMGPDDRSFPNAMLLPRAAGRVPEFAGLAILTHSDPRPLFPAIRSAVREIDPEQSIEGLRLAKDAYMERAAIPRFLFVVTAILAVVALGVIVIGVYGLLSYQIRQKRTEIGIRLALGASGGRLSWEVARGGMATVVAAAASGVLLALALSGIIRGLLYGVGPTDWRPLALVVTTVVVSGLAAALPPIRRVWNADPAKALRRE